MCALGHIAILAGPRKADQEWSLFPRGLNEPEGVKAFHKLEQNCG